MLALNKAYEAVPDYEIPLNQAYLLSSAGLYNEAEEYIELAKSTVDRNKYTFLWKDKHIKEIETILQQIRKHNESKDSTQ
jgi:hypothetical protein